MGETDEVYRNRSKRKKKMIPKYKLASLEALAKKYEATGRVVFIHPKKGTISVNGLSWPWQEA